MSLPGYLMLVSFVRGRHKWLCQNSSAAYECPGDISRYRPRLEAASNWTHIVTNQIATLHTILRSMHRQTPGVWWIITFQIKWFRQVYWKAGWSWPTKGSFIKPGPGGPLLPEYREWTQAQQDEHEKGTLPGTKEVCSRLVNNESVTEQGLWKCPRVATCEP